MECSGTKAMNRTILHDLYEKQKQSPYYDNLCRPVTDLLPWIATGIRGVTSNPAIFDKAISSSNAYNEQFRELLLEPIYNEKDGEDGFVSVEVSPRLADDTRGTIEQAKWLHKKVACPNVYIKIPATEESLPSIKEVISHGISVNVTLIFCLSRYEAAIDAYLDGLEASSMANLSMVQSAAAFYISRVDTVIDKKLTEIGTVEVLGLRGKIYQKKFSGLRWERLEKRGAKKQRLMWASTNVKNPTYPDTLYVASLIGPDTISTIPPEPALKAFMDHGIVSTVKNPRRTSIRGPTHIRGNRGVGN
ncbi:hypothetical protein K1719_014673 [Acacia pycnantha]|nr:hypothetical protein K1719_014673 [Acacia pycnantha]